MEVKNEPSTNKNEATEGKSAKRRDLEMLLRYFENQREVIRRNRADTEARTQELDQLQERIRQLEEFSKAEKPSLL